MGVKAELVTYCMLRGMNVRTQLTCWQLIFPPWNTERYQKRVGWGCGAEPTLEISWQPRKQHVGTSWFKRIDSNYSALKNYLQPRSPSLQRLQTPTDVSMTFCGGAACQGSETSVEFSSLRGIHKRNEQNVTNIFVTTKRNTVEHFLLLLKQIYKNKGSSEPLQRSQCADTRWDFDCLDPKEFRCKVQVTQLRWTLTNDEKFNTTISPHAVRKATLNRKNTN